MRREGALRGDRGRDCVTCAREGEEERVALRVDFRSAARPERLAHDAAVVARHIAVLVTELLEQPRRAFDVRKDERDGACREGRAHTDTVTP